MSKKRRRKAQQSQKPQKTWTPRWSQLAILAGVVLLVAIVLILKNRAADPPAAAESRPMATATLPKAQVQATATLPQAVGQTQATAEPEPVGSPIGATALPDELPEAQLQRLLTAGQPTLAFFHSNNCIQCTKMMAVVAQVYPEFDDSVALVDVNVYDESNSSLLQRANIRAIPTQIFFDETGRRTVVLGAMTPDEFRDQLRALAGAAGDCSDESTSGACAP
jgi:thiol:disulfide interchange protein